MYKLKRLLPVLLIAALLVLPAAPAFAAYKMQTSQPVESTKIVLDQQGNAMDAPTWVYGISIFADSATNAYMGVYDCDTLTELASVTEYPLYEIGEPVQYRVTTEMFDIPLYFSDGVGIIIFVGVGFIHYGPEPE